MRLDSRTFTVWSGATLFALATAGACSGNNNPSTTSSNGGGTAAQGSAAQGTAAQGTAAQGTAAQGTAAQGSGGAGTTTASGAGAGTTVGSGGASAGGMGGGGGDIVDPNCVAPPNPKSVPGTLPTEHVNFVSGVMVSTWAGSGMSGSADGDGAAATFDNPTNIQHLPDGSYLVTDFTLGKLRRVTAGGTVSTVFAGASNFVRPFGILLDDTGSLFVETDGDTNGTVNASAGAIWRVDLNTGIPQLVSEGLGRPRGLALVNSTLGTLIVTAHLPHHAVQLLNPVTKVLSPWAGSWNCPEFADGATEEARFRRPFGIAADLDGSILVADQGNHAIRRITTAGVVTTVAGKGAPGMVDGTVADAYFNAPRDIAVDAIGRIYVSDTGNHRIRRIDLLNDEVVTLAGNGIEGFADGNGAAARFYGQEGLTVSANGSVLHLADGTLGLDTTPPYHRLRQIIVP